MHLEATLKERTPLLAAHDIHDIPSFGAIGRNEKEPGGKHDPPERKSSILGLFRFATWSESLLLCVGLLFAALHGGSLPTLSIIFGDMTDTFITHIKQNNAVFNETDAPGHGNTSRPVPTNDTEHLENGIPMFPTEAMAQYSIYYLFIAIAVLFASFIQTLCWELTCEMQVYRMRRVFFSQLLRQDITWYDTSKTGDVTIKLTDDIERIREGIGCKFSMVLQYAATFVSGLAVGTVANWRLTLVILAVSPLLVGTSGYLAKIASSSAAREQLKYSIAGGIAEQVVCNMRTVAAFGGQEKAVHEYGKGLDEGRRLAMRKYYVLAMGIGMVFFVTYAAYGLAFYYGAHLIGQDISTPGSVFTVFFSVMAGAFALGNCLPFVNAVSTALGAAGSVFDILDRVPDPDPSDAGGLRLSAVKGHVEFLNVSFCYPCRAEVRVLHNLNLDVRAGQTVALVGGSGEGKSTVVSLLLRFYNLVCGKILLDGVDIKSLNLEWLRSQIGLVSQEPVLFGASIFDNIKYGHLEATFDDVVKAAKLANAHCFITALPQGYDTPVGSGGAQLSGGQKQRIAIARALVRDPRILLLDEATSALDANSEGVVQRALDNAMSGRTTIIIAHRLSTVRSADVIYVLKAGSVLEKGTHKELLTQQGLYYSLVQAQTFHEEEDHDYEYEHNHSIHDRMSDDGEKKSLDEHSSSLGGSMEQGIVCTVEAEKSIMELPPVSIDDGDVSRLFQMNSPEWVSLLVGIIGCALTGAVMPVFAYFYGEVFATFTLDGDELYQAALFWSLMFLVLAVASGISFWMQCTFMTTSAEMLIMRLRLKAFANILQQAVGWFDLDTSAPGSLTTKLARDAPMIKSAAGLRAGQMMGAVVTLTAALAIAFVHGWLMALLLLVSVPILAGASYQQMMILRRTQRRDAELLESAGRVASECCQNIRTVQALGRESLFVDLYMEHLIEPYKEAKKQAILYSVIFSVSQTVIYLMYAASFRFGAYLIESGDMQPTDVYRVFFALAFCAASIGQTSAYLQDYAKAKYSAAVMFQLIDCRSDINLSPIVGVKPTITGRILFSNVHFRYPNRPDVSVLRELNLVVEPGKTLALVGSSGCGKSTVIALLERFYDPVRGSVEIDGFDIRTITLPYLRNHIGLVTQEPTLFDYPIWENIAYGLVSEDPYLGNKEEIMPLIIEAAKTANIHEFISDLPEGYDTKVGEKGTQLSGGQKQRIAIARALIRDPKILLLDEATSALDTESERVVQEALDRAREGRTCIIVAHRLSTIQNADSIAVMHKGRVVEQGTHEELMSLKGRYSVLVQRQTL